MPKGVAQTYINLYVYTIWMLLKTEKILKRWEYQTTWPVSWEICMQVRKQQLEQQSGSKSGKEFVKAILSPCLFNWYAEYIMRNTGLEEAQAGIKISENYQWPQICRWHQPNGRKQRETKEPVDETERGEWKSWLKKLNIQKTKIMASGTITSW